jgi:hypothetical protein
VVVVANIDDSKTKQAKVTDEKPEPVESIVEEAPKTPVRDATEKEFLSPLQSTKKFANAARTFLTPVKNTPGKALITPRSLKPAQGKILPKSPVVFSFDPQPAKPKTEVPQNERCVFIESYSFPPFSLTSRIAIYEKLVSLQGNLLPVSSIDLFTVGVQTAPRLIAAGLFPSYDFILFYFIIFIFIFIYFFLLFFILFYFILFLFYFYLFFLYIFLIILIIFIRLLFYLSHS